jgi:hypothetical protein
VNFFICQVAAFRQPDNTMASTGVFADHAGAVLQAQNR